MKISKNILLILLILLTFIWCGLLIGISFMEAPLKFQAPNITRELALGIGQLVFNALNKIELFFAGMMVLCLIILKPRMNIWIGYAIPFLILLLQTLILFPILDVRINEILAGNEPEPSSHHIIYIISEVIKLASLIIVGIGFLKGNFKPIQS